jgi:23S rRNA pseudouridine1911/1915/1917 synthase
MADGLRDGSHTIDGEQRPLDRALRELHAGASWSVIRRAVTTGKVSIDDEVVHDPRTHVEAGQLVRICMTAPRGPQRHRLADDAILVVDSQIVVVRKPAGINTVPHEGTTETNLQRLVAQRIGRRGQPAPLIVVQRLDRETSGLLVFARTPAAQEHLKEQFGRRTVTRAYLALAAGHVKRATHRTLLVHERDGHGHSVRDPRRGKLAITHVEPVERLPGATLVTCRLETGRTHQIRIHLSEAGHPVLGDTMYTDRRISPPEAPRLMLHAATLGFDHPLRDERIELESPPPPDMQQLIDSLKA